MERSNPNILLPPTKFILEQLSGIPIQLPILICTTGHYTQELKKCPICRSKVIKCEFLENLIRSSTFLCPNDGCVEAKSGAEFQSHTDNYCHYRPIRCPFGECQIIVPFRFYFEHLMSRHRILGCDDSSKPSLEIPMIATPDINFGLFYKRIHNKIFFIRTYTNTSEVMFWVELYGERNDEKDYVANVHMKGKRGHKIISQFPVSPVRTDFNILNKTLACCQFTGKTVRQYFNNPNKVIVTIKLLLQENESEDSFC